MKKVLSTVCAAMAAVAVFAGKDNVVITFSTPGPDSYSDGSGVLPGECYALVWTPQGEAFAGINGDGTAAGGSKIVVAAPVAKDGKCPLVFFEVDEDYVAANYPDGTWSVVLLDTRVFSLGADGKPIVDSATGLRQVASVGNSNAVNGFGVVGSAKTVKGGTVESTGGVAAEAGSVASDTPAPVVKGLEFHGDNVYITISSTKPSCKYSLASGDAPDTIAAGANDPEDWGSASQDIILIKPKKAGGEFFKVNCK